jgi:hypothetical protein
MRWYVFEVLEAVHGEEKAVNVAQFLIFNDALLFVSVMLSAGIRKDFTIVEK